MPRESSSYLILPSTLINYFLVVFSSSQTMDLNSILIGNKEDIIIAWDYIITNNSGDLLYLGIEARRDRN